MEESMKLKEEVKTKKKELEECGADGHRDESKGLGSEQLLLQFLIFAEKGK
jgi:hypothetical protein